MTKLKDKKALDEWMRKTISSNTEDLIRKSQDEINDIINMTINKIVTEQKIEKLINIGALRIEQIRLEESKETDLPSINKEYEKEIIIYRCLNRRFVPDNFMRRFPRY